MADVIRTDQIVQEVAYTVGPDSVRRAILAYLNDTHNASFTDETTLKFIGQDAVVTTRFVTPGRGDAR